MMGGARRALEGGVDAHNHSTPTSIRMMTRPYLSRVVATSMVCAILGATLVLVARGVGGEDPAATLARTLGLGSGPVLGAILGGVLGGWLALGGPRRIAGVSGLLVGIAFVFVGWRLVQPHLWVLDIVMREALGEGGEVYSGLVLLLLAFPLYRAVGGLVAGFVRPIVERPGR